MQWLVAKNIAIFFALATTAFCISTIVLAVQKADLEDELQDARDKLDTATVTTTTTTTNAPVSTVPGDTTTAETGTTPAPDTTAGPGTTPEPGDTTTQNSSNSTSAPWPNVTLPQENPNYPTLPPGLLDPDDIVYRLPTDILPIKYRIYWHPDMTTRTCEGDISIQIEVYNQTNLIVMHAKELEIHSISILNMMARMRIRVKQYTLSAERELLIIELEELLYTETPYVVSMSYSSKLDGLMGMYVSSYTDQDGNEKWIATSKFEPTYARQAFPCFDEPAMKAAFTITVVRPTGDGYHALSNMNIESEEVEGDVTVVTFAESVPMSTYLACFIVSDFAHQSKTVNGTLPNANDFEMRVFATPEQVNKVSYALEAGVGITEYYIDYFNVYYPLPKLDMAAIPDFVSGAMEHWGLVTYRETALLYDPSISSSANKQRVATVVAHELAHMWFGNLVTMKWWNDLWLNEGFASYIEYKGVNKIHPEWKMLDQFLIADLHSVMKLDATLASHPIVQTVESPDEITEIFDSITYSKGASIIRMLDNLVGEEIFRNATTNYLSKYMYINAETDDFLTQIEQFDLEFNVKLIMQTWTTQMGLPVVEITQDGNTYKLTQKRFLSNPDDYDATHAESSFNYRWSIPITYFTSSNSEVQSLIFDYNDNQVTITVPSAVDWIKINKNQYGYYRVNYPTNIWNALISQLNTNRGVFSESDRAHLISDVFALADAKQLEYSIALDLTTYLKMELNYVPWSVGTSRLNAVKNLLYFTDLYRDFIIYARELVNTVYEEVTWTVGTDHLFNLLRVNILNAACAFGHNAALEEAGTRFKAWLANPSERPDPDLRSTIYTYGMQAQGNENTWEQVWQLFIAETDAQEKIKLMESLAAVKEPWILQRFINLAWNEDNVRGQDYFTCLQYIAGNRNGQSLVWDYVRENWQKLVDRFTINNRYLGRLIPSITARFATSIKLEEMETFFTKYPDAGAGTSARKEALENVKNNIQWLEQNKEQVGDWLKNHNQQSQKKT